MSTKKKAAESTHAGEAAVSAAVEQGAHQRGTGRGAPLTDRTNVEPPILRGITATEAQVIGGLSVVVFILLSLLIWAITGYWQMIVVLAVLGPLCTIWVTAGYLASIKRGRPDGYYTQALRLWAIRRGFARSRFTLHDHYWSLGRPLANSLGISLEPKVDLYGRPPLWERLLEDLSPTAFAEDFRTPARAKTLVKSLVKSPRGGEARTEQQT